MDLLELEFEPGQVLAELGDIRDHIRPAPVDARLGEGGVLVELALGCEVLAPGGQVAAVERRERLADPLDFSSDMPLGQPLRAAIRCLAVL
jgi:hypothetical protein